MPKTFLSHSSVQHDLVKRIANKLGYDNCVLDEYHFSEGEPTLSQIFDKIDQSDLFVIFLSDEALNSNWVKREIDYQNTIKDPGISRRLLIFLVDKRIAHNDNRIPEWLRKQYNIQEVLDEIHLYKKIDSKVRDIALEKYPHIKIKEEIFVGRNQLMDEFEEKYYSLDNIKPSCIIASGFEEVGRRKFLLNALDKVKKVNKFHNPISITLDSRDSIEDFILRIEDLNSKNTSETVNQIRDIDLDAKLQYAKELLLSFKKHNEILFIIDKGCLVQPNKQIASWFDKLICDEQFSNITIVCVISTIRPLNSGIYQKRQYLAFHVNTFDSKDTRKLFVKYCSELFKIEPPKEVAEQILSILDGMPSQIYYASDLLNTHGPNFITKKFNEIRQYNDVRVYSVIKQIKDESDLFFDLLVFLSKIEYISYHLVYRVFGRSKEVESALEHLFVYGVYSDIGPEKENLQVHSAIVEYVRRSRYRISDKTKLKLKAELKAILSENYNYPDVSQMLLTIKSLVEDGGKIPDNLFLPSFVLRLIIDNYYAGKYEQVESIANELIGKESKYDSQIIRETRYWLCQTLARKLSKNKTANQDKFYEQLRNFDGSDHYFLLGFHQRLQGKMAEAEESFNKVLSIDRVSQKSKRELVNVLLSQDKYSEALSLAKDNYNRRPLNAFHIQAYFICLTRQIKLSTEDKKEINNLMQSIQISHDAKASEIYQCMQAEYEYYINGDVAKAIEGLEKNIREATFKNYPQKALLQIYRRRGFREKEQELRSQILASKTDTDTYLD